MLSCCSVTNPLVGLSSTALRLYGALEVFKKAYQSPKDQDWFRAPQLIQRLQQIGFSKSEIQKGFKELTNAGLLQVRTERGVRWYQLK